MSLAGVRSLSLIETPPVDRYPIQTYVLEENKNVTYSEKLHLGVSLRSFRAEKLSAFVHALLSVEPDKASELYKEIKDRYPIVLTRDMEKAKAWLHSKVRGTVICGTILQKSTGFVYELRILGHRGEGA